jgi:signal transduction histidine kinase
MESDAPLEADNHVGSHDRDAARKTVLIVEDSPTMRRLLTKKVEGFGFAVIPAEDGEEAVEKAVASSPDIVLMDITMPKKNGFEACKEIKARLAGTHVPVIFVTSLDQPKERLNALEAGGDDFINKPVQNEDLLFRIKTHLRIRELAEDLKRVNENLEDLVAERTTTLLETERHLFQAEKMSTVGTMLSGIAHELRNPLSSISAWARMLEKKGESAQEREKALGFINSSLEKSSAIIENLLKLARKKVEETISLSLNAMVEELTGNLQYLISDKSIEIRTDLRSTGTIRGNAAEIEQVLLNLVSNAVGAIDRKGTITIATMDSGRSCGLSVSDDGCGMDEQVRKSMFDPFFTTKPPGKGTGLGMRIVFKIVTAYQGRIAVDSTVGKGTKISVFFPKAEV